MDQSRKLDLFSHLSELRQRLVVVAWTLVVSTSVGYWQSSRALVWLTKPLVQLYHTQDHKARSPWSPSPALPPGQTPLTAQSQPSTTMPPASRTQAPAQRCGAARRFIYTGLTEAFLTHLKMALFVGLLLSTPVIAYQVWGFVHPALSRSVRGFYGGLISLAPGLFVAGATLAHQVICPKAWAFFLSFEDTTDLGIPLHFEAKLSDYVSLTLKLMMGFGMAFQLPVALALAVSAGWVQLDTLRRGRKYAFLVITIVAAIVTPPDLISPLGLMIPVYGLYEATLWALGWTARRGRI